MSAHRLRERPSFPIEADEEPFVDHFDVGISGPPQEGRLHVRCAHCDRMHENGLPKEESEDERTAILVVARFKCCTRANQYTIVRVMTLVGATIWKSD